LFSYAYYVHKIESNNQMEPAKIERLASRNL
jgi:hypothetical protein